MRILSILVISLITFGCSVGSFPAAPEIKKHYMVDIRGVAISHAAIEMIANPEAVGVLADSQVVRCLEFDVMSWHPYKIKFNSEVDLTKCNLVGGYSPDDIKKILNWSDDVYVWANDRKHCFKN